MSITPEKIPQDILTEEDKRHMAGKENWLIRMYFYLSSGLQILNESRNLFLGIFALYVVLKLENWIWLVIIFIPSVIGLIIAGRYNVHRISKEREWLGMRFSTHYGIRTFNYTQLQTELLQEIRDLLLESKNRK